MKTGIKEQSAKVIGYKIILILVIGAAGLSNAAKDLNQLQQLSDNVWRLSSQLLAAGVTTVNAKSASAGDGVCKTVSNSEELVWNARMRPSAIEIDGDITANLPSSVSSELRANRYKRTTSSEFPRRMFRMARQRRVNDALENEVSELVLKTFNGSVHLRPASWNMRRDRLIHIERRRNENL